NDAFDMSELPAQGAFLKLHAHAANLRQTDGNGMAKRIIQANRRVTVMATIDETLQHNGRIDNVGADRTRLPGIRRRLEIESDLGFLLDFVAGRRIERRLFEILPQAPAAVMQQKIKSHRR